MLSNTKNSLCNMQVPIFTASFTSSLLSTSSILGTADSAESPPAPQSLNIFLPIPFLCLKLPISLQAKTLHHHTPFLTHPAACVRKGTSCISSAPCSQGRAGFSAEACEEALTILCQMGRVPATLDTLSKATLYPSKPTTLLETTAKAQVPFGLSHAHP